MSEDEFLHRAINVPMQTLQWGLAKHYGVDVVVRRDDLIDNSLSGNKFYKLFYNLHQAKSIGYQTLLSFGGAHSNHIYSLAAAGRNFGFKTIGVIRGERPVLLSPMLQDAERWGMQLHFVSRVEYNQKTSSEFNEYLCKIYGDFYSIPEGGSNSFGFQGTQIIGQALDQKMQSDYNAVCIACGTGNTLAGVAAGVANDASIVGFSVLKGEGDLGESILAHHQLLSTKPSNWRLISGYHTGGYGKKLPLHVQNFCKDFERETSINLDPVYTVKMFWGVSQLLKQQYWPRGSRLVLVHTGGLQGRRGFMS